MQFHDIKIAFLICSACLLTVQASNSAKVRRWDNVIMYIMIFVLALRMMTVD